MSKLIKEGGDRIKKRYPKTHRRYKVIYNLAYDGGGCEWDGYYRTLLGANIAIFWNLNLASWGGLYKLYDQKKEADAQADS